MVISRNQEGEKTVLVKLETVSGCRNRPIAFKGGKKELILATEEKFKDVLVMDGELYMQILDESWGDGVFVDLLDQNISDRSVLKAVEIKVHFYIQLYILYM